MKHVHAIRTRKVGAGLFVDFHIPVDGETTVRKGHQVSQMVKFKLTEQGPEILDVVVHLEPYDETFAKRPLLPNFGVRLKL